ncbi:lysine exporter LysO family protein [Pectobacteriaceae bacterium CE70]|nr:lysine exporter LysO family protein [Pectobacteriaceae bacterium C52]WJV68368.1 lysine exporter LysO family protein [Pectobacteriaceae bacterium CE70]WJY12299.1 lysine exporter LysO family protein [Pectobacteriaceae bacterium C80]
MSIALSNLIPIFLVFFLGIKHQFFIPHTNLKIVEKLSNACLYFLLIFMGITVGLIPDITEKLVTVGVNAISIAVASSLSIAIVLKVFHYKENVILDEGMAISDNQKVAFDLIGYIKDPLVLTGLVIIGFFLGYRQIIPTVNYDILITALLYLLIFFIGIKLSRSGLNLKEVFFNRNNVIMTLLTVFSSYIGAIIVSFFIPLSLTHCLAISSGFGWYTLSGILFTKMNNPLLGSVAFLCDLFREAIALLLIPTLSRIGNGNIAIGVAGATAMDVTLPVIEKHCGTPYVPVALLSGGVITILVPFLIPFFYSL